jgi:hypothetical protein
MSRFRLGIFVVLAVALMFGFAAAQVPTGRIQGKVSDDQGTPLPGVSVTCDSTRLVGLANTVTDQNGVYRIFSLPSGLYSVRFELPGFQRITRREIVVQVEQTITLNIIMVQSALAEEITVVGKSPLIDVRSTTKGSTMSKDVFMSLPRSRNFDGLLSTVPGVQYEMNQGRGDNGGMTVDGASGGENVFYIDGSNVTNMHVGVQAQRIVMEQLEEVKVTASGYSAEFGGSLGGVVNVITRSGGNEFHGDAFGYYNNNKLWMQGKDRESLRLNPYDQTIAEYYSSDILYYNNGKNRDDTQRYEGVFNLGGFILKDRLWFFGSFDPIYNRTYADRWFTSDPTHPENATIPGDTRNDPRQGRDQYNFYTKNWNYNWQAKITAAPFKGMRMSISAVSNFSNSRGSIPSIAGTSAKNSPWIASWDNTIVTGVDPGLDYPNLSGNATIDYTISNNFLASVRAGYHFLNTTNQQISMPGTRWAFGTSNATISEIPASLQHFAGWTNWAGTVTQNNKTIYERMSGNLDLTYYLTLAGEHAIKGGVQYMRLHEDVDAGYQHPSVSIYWSTPAIPQFYDLPNGQRVQGQYGYYSIIHDFISPYGNNWNIHSDNWSIYLQDSWTIGDKFTFNYGLRTESEYIPSFTTDTTEAGYTAKPIQFGFGDKLAPRLGAVYDVFGDSSLKVFASFGLYYDVMKLYVAEGTTGGFKWWTSYYSLDNYNWDQIAASGDRTNRADQGVGGTYYMSRNWRHTAFEMFDPDMKPMSQSETSFGAEKKVTEEISFSARLVYKHLIKGIEDIGLLETDAQGNISEAYYQGNPGFGYSRPESEGGKMSDLYWPCPKAKREYLGLNLTLEKRFSNNWQGGVNYTLSRLTGNYSGLNSSDETGRQGANQDRFFDSWFERYDIHGNPLDGVLASDRTHFFKAYGSYAFPFGFTVGVTAYGRSGWPRSTTFTFNDMTAWHPEGYGDLGRMPFTFYADAYFEYNLRFAKRYTVNINATFTNITNTKTITGYYDTPVRVGINASDADLLSKNFDWRAQIASHTPDPRYGLWSSRFGTWSWRLGARFSF